MKRFAFAVALTLTAVVGSLTPAYAQTTPGLAIPVVSTGTAAVFNGTFTLRRFVRAGDGVAAVGTLSGIATPVGGTPVSIFRDVMVEAQVGTGATPVTTGSQAAFAVAAVCPVLHLDLGPLFLDLLGVQIDLSRVILDVTAVSGSGQLLGNLVCTVVGLLDPGGGIVARSSSC